MRMGMTRNEALKRLCIFNVDELHTFIAVLIEINQLGTSISQVLHSQADQMRRQRRQRAEELARQASVKIVIVLVFFLAHALYCNFGADRTTYYGDAQVFGRMIVP